MTPLGTVLVLSEQPLIAALVGLLIELAGAVPAFANPAELPADAVQRVRPIGVVLVDAEMDAARSDLFFAMTARRGAGVAVFGSDGHIRAIAEIAAARRIPWFTLPPNIERLRMVLSAAAGKQRNERSQERRRPAEATRTADGTRILRDTTGRHWAVYDRRGGHERRSSDERTGLDRVFVAEDGETRSCQLSGAAEGNETADLLVAQLAEAVS
jgi:DNA-binding NtrC family response regulator